MSTIIENLRSVSRFKPFTIEVPGWGATKNIYLPGFDRKSGKGKKVTIKPSEDASKLHMYVIAIMNGKFASNWRRPNSQNRIYLGLKSEGALGIFVYVRFKRQIELHQKRIKNPKGDLNPFTKEGYYTYVPDPKFEDFYIMFEQRWQVERSGGSVIVTKPTLIGPTGKLDLVRLGIGDPKRDTWLNFQRVSKKPYVKISFGLRGPVNAISPNSEKKIGYFILNIDAPVIKPIRVPTNLEHPIFFKFNSSDAKGGQLSELENWLDAISSESPQLYRAIAIAKCRIYLSGYASSPGSLEYNRRLAAKRMVSVEEAIKGHFSRSIKNKAVRIDFKKTNYGEKLNKQRGKVEREQRVEVIINKTEAATVIAKELKD